MSKPNDDFPFIWIDVQREFISDGLTTINEMRTIPEILVNERLFGDPVGYEGQFDAKHFLMLTEDKKDESVK